MQENSPRLINGNFKGKDILSLDQFDSVSLGRLFDATAQTKKLLEERKTPKLLQGSIVSLYFDEPSTRTRASFGSATKRLGGTTIEMGNPQSPNNVTGESFYKVVSTCKACSDIIVIRHPQTGAAEKATDISKTIPVINAGDGGAGEHPTQALLDLYTIYEKLGKLDHLVGVAAGDILYGRTVKSLIKGLALFPGNTLYLLSPKELKLSKEDFDNFTKRGIKLIQIESEKGMPKNAHFWYWTRTQKERFTNLATYERVKNRFILNRDLINRYSGENTIFMHPLPRVGEIAVEVDDDPRAVYLTTQIRNGLYVRMALVALVLGGL